MSSRNERMSLSNNNIERAPSPRQRPSSPSKKSLSRQSSSSDFDRIMMEISKTIILSDNLKYRDFDISDLNEEQIKNFLSSYSEDLEPEAHNFFVETIKTIETSIGSQDLSVKTLNLVIARTELFRLTHKVDAMIAESANEDME
jgi:hypothetical protein